MKFLLTISNPNGSAPTASDLTFFLNGTEEAANITAIGSSGTSTQSFVLTWIAKTTPNYPSVTLQNLTLRFRDAQKATTTIKLARIDVAEWEGMISFMAVSYNNINTRTFSIGGHRNGVQLPIQSAIGGAYGSGAGWYRGPLAVKCFATEFNEEPPGVNVGPFAIVSGMRYPHFLVDDTGSPPKPAYTVRDFSNPILYPHGFFGLNQWSGQIKMEGTGATSLIPRGSNNFFPLPQPVGETIGYLFEAKFLQNGEWRGILNNIWAIEARTARREINTLTTAQSSTYTRPTALDWSHSVPIEASIVASAAGSLEYPGLPSVDERSGTPLVIAQGQWHRIVVKVGPDAAVVARGVRLRLNVDEIGSGAPQAGIEFKRQTDTGFESFTPNEILEGSPLYTELTGQRGLVLFVKLGSGVDRLHRLTLDLLPNSATLEPISYRELTLLPVEVRGYVTGERIGDAGEKYRHRILDPTDYTGSKTESKTELKIVQWGDNYIFDPNNNSNFDHAKFKEDVDIFRIRLPDIDPPAGTAEHRIKIWTVDAAGTTLDEGAKVDLNVFDDFHETAALGLVADDETDDTFAVEGKADGALGDRTYRAKLGGKLKFQWLTCPGTGDKPIFEIPIPVKKIVTAKGFLLKGTTAAATATYWFERAKKIYSAIGVDLKYTLEPIDPLPAGVTLDKFDIPIEITGHLHRMMPETKALMDDTRCQVAPGTIPVFFVNELEPAAQGVTNAPSYMAPGDEKYGGAIFIDSTHTQESVLTHELAHVLLDAQHEPSSNALWNDYFLSYDRWRTNIWFGNQGLVHEWSETGISAHRRLADTMRARIWKSSYAKNPEP